MFANVEGLSDEDVPGGDVASCLGFDALAPTAGDDGDVAAWEYV